MAKKPTKNPAKKANEKKPVKSGKSPAKKATKNPAGKPVKNNAPAGKGGAQKATAAKSSPPEQPEEKQNAIRKLIAWLKRLIGYKKGERDEFRFNLETNHPNYIFEEQNGKRSGVGITHEESTHGKKNMPLSQNPDKNDPEAAYVRYGIVKGRKKDYGKRPIKKMTFAPKDKANVKSKVRNYKKRRKQSRKNSKKKGK